MTQDQPESTQRESRWRSLWRRPKSRLLLGIPVGGYLLFVIATASAQLDTDTTLDQWHVNDAKQDLLTPDSNDV